MASTWRVPLVVLVDENSASASEIFAAAIRDHHRGTIVGNQSYGKGSVQGIFPLNVSGGGVRLTTAKFFSPTGQPISEVGVKADVIVHETAKTNEETDLNPEDAGLRVGIQTARRAQDQRNARNSVTVFEAAIRVSKTAVRRQIGCCDRKLGKSRNDVS